MGGKGKTLEAKESDGSQVPISADVRIKMLQWLSFSSLAVVKKRDYSNSFCSLDTMMNGSLAVSIARQTLVFQNFEVPLEGLTFCERTNTGSFSSSQGSEHEQCQPVSVAQRFVPALRS